MWANWVAILAGLWVIISPFVLTAANSLKWSNVISGIVVAVLVYYGTTMKPK